MVVTTSNLSVRYGAFTALQDVTCQIPEGCIGLLGPNGAGKTTLLKVLLGFIKPSSGTAAVLGVTLGSGERKIRQMLGYMPEQDCHIPGLSAVQFVAFAGELAGLPSGQALRRSHEVLEYCGLGEARYRLVESYSTGMKQRIKLAQALVHGPRLLLLDEPTNGLDPLGREEMLELVRSVSHEKGVSVIVSSHLLPDIERTCDEVVVVSGGRMRAQGLISDLKKIAGQPVDVELREPVEGFLAACSSRGLQLMGQEHARFRFQGLDRPDTTSRAVLESARASGAQVRRLVPAERSLEEAILEAVNG
ncbi:MAG: ABC transporter ATP-binding protein [Fimbriimonadaceae bacterium]|nr:ABC transporter ATP-binding protein [Fimbriimonadaceae bacterium]QYK58444.1 MAG: ABC transporter ATP-binding protein [Fimbriimonadaceae bacterium]